MPAKKKQAKRKLHELTVTELRESVDDASRTEIIEAHRYFDHHHEEKGSDKKREILAAALQRKITAGK